MKHEKFTVRIAPEVQSSPASSSSHSIRDTCTPGVAFAQSCSCHVQRRPEYASLAAEYIRGETLIHLHPRRELALAGTNTATSGALPRLRKDEECMIVKLTEPRSRSLNFPIRPLKAQTGECDVIRYLWYGFTSKQDQVSRIALGMQRAVSASSIECCQMSTAFA